MKEKFKDIGSFVLGIGGFILILFLGILMIKGTVWVGEYALQWLINFSWIVFAVNLFILLPLALFKKTGVVGGIGMLISSYVFGLTLWFLGLLLTYFTWGFLGVFIGLILGGVGVIPVAMLASIVNGDFLTLLVLVILTALTFGTRMLGIYLAAKAEKDEDVKIYKDAEYEEKDEKSPLTFKENEELIYAYNLLREKDPVCNKPNYELAKKVFLDFNEFNLRNTENGLMMYLKFIPKSLLPYPKNYIKCAYYIFLEKLEKENDIRMFKNVQHIGTWLFNAYPDYKKYKENITGKNTNGNGKKWMDDALKDSVSNPRESFKKIYGVYEISEEDYNNSTSSIDSTDEKLIHDFGVLPEIEEDVDVSEVMKRVEYEEID